MVLTVLAAIDAAIVHHPLLFPAQMPVREAIASLPVAHIAEHKTTERQEAEYSAIARLHDRERSRYACVMADDAVIGVIATDTLLAVALQEDEATIAATLARLMSPVTVIPRATDFQTRTDLLALSLSMRHQELMLVPVLDDRGDRSDQDAPNNPPLGFISEASLLHATQSITLTDGDRLLQTILDHRSFPMSVFWKDRDSVYLGCNRTFLRDANLTTREEILGKNDFELPWAETNAEAYRADDRAVMEANEPKLAIIETQHRDDGTQVWLETNKIPLNDPDGSVVGVLGLYQDISQRKQTEQDLQQLSMRLNLAVRSAGIGIWDWDVVNDVLMWDAQMYALYGVDRRHSHEVYDLWVSSLHPDDAAMAQHAIQQALADERDCNIEFRIVQPNGDVRYLQANAMVQRDDRGQPLRMIGTNSDVTDRKHTEQLLRHQLATINASSDGIGILRDDCYIALNSAHVTMFGYEHESELIGQNWRVLYTPESVTWFEQNVFPILLRDRTWQGEAIGQCKDGSPICQDLSLTLSDDDTLICVSRDIRDRKRTEAALRNSEARWQFALEGVGDGVWDWNLETGEVFYSRQWKAILGYQDDEILHTFDEWRDHIHPEDVGRCCAILDDYLNGTIATYRSEYRARCKDDSYKWVLDRGQVIEYSIEGNPQRMIGIQSDIADRKQAEQQLRDAKEAAELANSSKSNFLALMSHEIRTPINGVLGLAYLMQQTSLDPQQREYLDRLQMSAASLSQIVNDILDFSKLGAEQLKIEAVEFELDEILDRLRSMLTLKAEEKQLDLHFEVGKTVPRRLVGDPLRIGQVAINLVSNAIKFTDRGSVTVQIERLDQPEPPEPNPLATGEMGEETDEAAGDRHHSEETGSARLRFAVHDTGIGLSTEQLENLFEPFTQADSSVRRRQEGTGLGLTICRRLVQLMGGTIEVHSELGQGSTFFFELDLDYRPIAPSAAPNPATQPSRSQPDLNLPDRSPPDRSLPSSNGANGSNGALATPPTPLIPTSHFEGVSILVVEDNEVNQLVACKVLEQFGLSADFAMNGRQAIAQVLCNRYDLILMDIRMPEMDGRSATRRIRRLFELGTSQAQWFRDVPIIAMTAHAFASDRQRSLDAGMNDHLSKPIDPDLLHAKLDYWLQATQPTPASGAIVSNAVSKTIVVDRPSARDHAPVTPRPIAPKRQAPSEWPELNIAAGLAHVYGDETLYRELLQLFADIYTPFATDLATAFEDDDEQVIYLVHTLKGAAANIAADVVVKQADRILEHLRSPTQTPLRFESADISTLLRSLDRILHNIQDYLATES